jgi:hypothetical protein
VRTPLPPPLVEPDTAEHQAPTSGEIEMPGVDLYSAPKLFVVPEPVVPVIAPSVKSSASKSSPKRMALPARMHTASPTPEPPPTQVAQTSGMPATIVDRKPTPKSMPVVQPPVEAAFEVPEVPEVEEATALRDQLTAKPMAPSVNPMSPRGFAPPQPELSPLQPQIDVPDPVPSVPAWSPLTHAKSAWPPSGLATSEPFSFPPAVLRSPVGNLATSTSELPRVPSRGRFAIATLLVAAALTAGFAWLLSAPPRSSLATPVVADVPAAVAPAAPVATTTNPVANSSVAIAPAPAHAFGTGGNKAKPVAPVLSAVDAATAAALAPPKPVRHHASSSRSHVAAAPATPDRTVNEGRIVDPFASMK